MATIRVSKINGIDTRNPQPQSACTALTNWAWDQRNNGWDNRIGYERYFFQSSSSWAPFTGMGRIDTVHVWNTHSGARNFVFFETGGALYMLSEWGTTFSAVNIEDREQPAPSRSPGTYIEFGRNILIINGQDTPRKLNPWPCQATAPTIHMKQLGWYAACPPPEPWEVDVSPGSTTNQPNGIGIWAGGTGTFTNKEMAMEIGLGSRTNDEVNSYIWWCTFVNEDGSESPISAPSKRITWTTPGSGTWDSYRFVVGMNIPVGPLGTAARRIYRTLNLGQMDTEAVTGYFVDEIANNIEDFYYDSKADVALITPAPSVADSIVFPSQSARFGCVFMNRLFLDGGPANENSIYWSNAGQPDSYSALNFTTLSSRACGSVTGWMPTENMVVILRERGVEAILPLQDGSFFARPYLSNIGSSAGHTLTNVPGLGVLFLARDGVYRISGSRDGGGQMGAGRISDQIQDVFDRLNPATLARACAAYSHKWNEWHCYFAVDGSNVNNIGIVFHLDNQQWSIREGFPVSCIDVTFNGELVFGHNTGDTGNDPIEAGLFVISRRRALGQYRVSSGGENPTYTIVDNDPPTSTFRSAWLGAGDENIQVSASKVTVFGHVMGNNEIPVRFYVDDENTSSNTAGFVPQQANKAVRSVYDTLKMNSTYVAAGAPTWQSDPIPTAYRVDVSRFAADRFMFEIETTNDLVIRGFTVDFEANNPTPAARRS